MSDKEVDPNNPNNQDARSKLERSKKLKSFLKEIISCKLNLNSVTKFSQIFIPEFRLVTLIGENHKLNWKCNPFYSNVSDYCLQRVNDNKNCRILLEFKPGSDPLKLNSEIIRTTYLEFYKKNLVDYIIPFDYRSHFLTTAGQNTLYNYYNFRLLSQEEIVQKFIEPYFVNLQQAFNLTVEDYEASIANYLVKVYVGDLTSHFQIIAKNLNQQSVSSEKIHSDLSHAWKKVCDFYVLKEVLKRSEVNGITEFVVIAGEYHFTNLNIVLSSIGRRLNLQSGDPGSCVNLLNTYKI